MKQLKPSLSDIESNLFDPSDTLIECWVNKPESLKADTLARLERDERAQTLRQQYIESRDISDVEFEDEFALSPSNYEVPETVRAMITQRCATQARFAQVSEPQAGQIRLVDRTIGPDGTDLEWDMNYPLTVMLARQTEHKDVWYGWMVSRETVYAGPLDVVLDDGDAPYDPLVGMVQLWNPVHIFVGSVGQVVGQVSRTRLATMQALFTDHMVGIEEESLASSEPGTHVERLVCDGHTVTTGTPLGTAGDDPRHRYQTLYLAAAGLVKDLAQLAVRATENQ